MNDVVRDIRAVGVELASQSLFEHVCLTTTPGAADKTPGRAKSASTTDGSTAVCARCRRDGLYPVERRANRTEILSITRRVREPLVCVCALCITLFHYAPVCVFNAETRGT